MISYRHHVVSLVAVFLALAAGVALGGGPLSDLARDPATTSAKATVQRQEAQRVASFGDDFATEQLLLRALPAEPFETGLSLRPRVDRHARVTVRQCQYSVPACYVGRQLRVLLRATLEELLPLDDQRRTSLRVMTAYYSRSLTDPALAAVFLHEGSPLEDLVSTLITAAGARPSNSS